MNNIKRIKLTQPITHSRVKRSNDDVKRINDVKRIEVDNTRKLEIIAINNGIS
jgi:hypothetical protein